MFSQNHGILSLCYFFNFLVCRAARRVLTLAILNLTLFFQRRHMQSYYMYKVYTEICSPPCRRAALPAFHHKYSPHLPLPTAHCPCLPNLHSPGLRNPPQFHINLHAISLFILPLSLHAQLIIFSNSISRSLILLVMSPTLLKPLLLAALLSGFVTAQSDFGDPTASLKVPASEFVNSVRATIGILGDVISLVSQYSGVFGDFRLRNAVSDCLDLMDLSIDQLNWTLSVLQNPHGKDNSTGNVGSDMKTWLSGALINQDTCKEGFDGTNGFVGNLIAGSLEQVTSLIYQILSNVGPTSANNPPKVGAPANGGTGGKGSGGGGRSGGRKLVAGDKYPEWVKSQDRELLQAANGGMADVVVALDGTGNFSTIMDAVHAAPQYGSRRYVIYVKRGVYREYVEISKKKWNIMMIGDGVDATVISGNRNFVDGWTTYRSATFAVKGQGFIARDITFENTSGPEKHQAVAFRSDSDLSVVYRCRITGFQDTLYAHSQRQFYRECQITGTVDFIFGDGTVVFQSCDIRARKGLPNQKNTITAHGRKESVENTGFSIQFCNISTEPDVPVNSTQTYLGRPWKMYSRTVIMQSYISDTIRPEGWLEWNGNFALNTLFYGEYMNYGPGSGLGNRVKWTGYRVLNSSAEANNFTVSQFILGNTWLPNTGVRYTAGLAV